MALRRRDLNAFRERALTRGVNPFLYWPIRAILILPSSFKMKSTARVFSTFWKRRLFPFITRNRMAACRLRGCN